MDGQSRAVTLVLHSQLIQVTGAITVADESISNDCMRTAASFELTVEISISDGTNADTETVVITITDVTITLHQTLL